MKRSLSYEELRPLILTQPKEIERLITEGLLDDATIARVEHLHRWLSRIAERLPAGAKVGDVFTAQELQVLWHVTADPDVGDADIGHHPVLH